jgi:hypothetical protein
MDHPKTPEANASSIIHFLQKFYLMLNLLIVNNPCIWHNTKLHQRIPFKSHPLKSIITNGKKDVVFSSSMLSKIVSEKTRVPNLFIFHALQPRGNQVRCDVPKEQKLLNLPS